MPNGSNLDLSSNCSHSSLDWASRLTRSGLLLPEEVISWFRDELDPELYLYNEIASPFEFPAGRLAPDCLPIADTQFGDYICLRFSEDDSASLWVWDHDRGQLLPLDKPFHSAQLHLRISEMYADYWPQVSSILNSADLDSYREAVASVISRTSSEINVRAQAPYEDNHQVLPFVHSDEFDPSSCIVSYSVASACAFPLLPQRWKEVWNSQICPQIEGCAGIDPLSYWEVSHNLNNKVCDDIDKVILHEFGIDREKTLSFAHLAALHTIQLRNDMAWAYELCGWFEERAGNISAAVQLYRLGLQCLGATRGFVEGWEDRTKSAFGPHRLISLRKAHGNSGQTMKDWLNPDENKFLDAIQQGQASSFFRARGKDHLDSKNYGAAYSDFYRAGWDTYQENDLELLSLIHQTAQLAGYNSREQVAAIHLSQMQGFAYSGHRPSCNANGSTTQES